MSSELVTTTSRLARMCQRQFVALARDINASRTTSLGVRHLTRALFRRLDGKLRIIAESLEALQQEVEALRETQQMRRRCHR